MKEEEDVLYVHVRYKVKPGMRNAFVEAIKKAKISSRTMEEPGNFGYEFLIPMENEDELFLVECWENEEVLVPHREKEHFKELQTIKAEYVLNTEIKRIN